jgi:hypothetical protein
MYAFAYYVAYLAFMLSPSCILIAEQDVVDVTLCTYYFLGRPKQRGNFVLNKEATLLLLLLLLLLLPIPVAARSKAWICGRSLTGIAGLNPAGGMDVCLL